MHPIAKCQNPECGSIFNAPSMFMGNSRATTFKNVVVDCPKCGGPAGVLDGTFDFIDNTIRLLSGPQSTIDVLTKLAQTIRYSVEAGESADKTLERITEIAPWLAGLKKFAKSQVVNFVWSALSVIAGYEYTQYRENQTASLRREQQVEIVQEANRRDRESAAWEDFQSRMREPLPEPPRHQSERYRLPSNNSPLIVDAPHTFAKLAEYAKHNKKRH